MKTTMSRRSFLGGAAAMSLAAGTGEATSRVATCT
jgi:hypothetical protein